MAQKDDLEVKDENAPGSKKKMIIIFAILGVVLIGATVGVTLMLVGGGGDEEAAAEQAEPAKPVPHYLEMESLVVNFAEKGPARFMQVDLQVMAHDQAVLSAVEEHMPVIRNNILMLLGSQSFDSVSTREGKEKLRQDIVADMQTVLRDQAGIVADESVKNVYFTNFVMQ